MTFCQNHKDVEKHLNQTIIKNMKKFILFILVSISVLLFLIIKTNEKEIRNDLGMEIISNDELTQKDSSDLSFEEKADENYLIWKDSDDFISEDYIVHNIANKLNINIPEKWTKDTIDENLTIFSSENQVQFKILVKEGVTNSSYGVLDSNLYNLIGNQVVTIGETVAVLPSFSENSSLLFNLYEDFKIFNLFFFDKPVIEVGSEYTTLLDLKGGVIADIVIVLPNRSLNNSEKKELYYILKSIVLL